MSTLDQFIATTLQAVGRGARALGISSPSSDIDWYRRIYLPGSSELSTAKATHRMVGGIPVPLESDASTEPVIELEQEATQGLCNISRLERKRRLNIAKQFAVMAALMVLGFILAGDSVPRFARFLVWLPLGASVGMGGSAAAGICGISHQKLWDPDGKGIRKVPNQALAEAIWNKAKKLYMSEVLATALCMAIFVYNPWV